MATIFRNRKQSRLKGYDYAQEGAYFVTICTFGQMCLFGNIVDGKMTLNVTGKIVRVEWLKTPIVRSNITLDEFVVMPNHVHGIIVINRNTRRGVMHYAPTNQLRYPSQIIGSIIRGFKSAITKRINEICNLPTRFAWQRNYDDHIIRNIVDLNHVRQYINNNPIKWDLDRNNPINLPI